MKGTNKHFELSFRSRKQPHQSCYIPKSALTENGIYYTISGKLTFAERNWMKYGHCDVRLVREYGNWYVVIPLKMATTTLPCSENQRQGDVVAIDPGIRSFLTYFFRKWYIWSNWL